MIFLYIRRDTRDNDKKWTSTRLRKISRNCDMMKIKPSFFASVLRQVRARFGFGL